MDNTTNAHIYINATNLELLLVFETIAGHKSKGILKIRKHLTAQGDKEVEDTNTERFVSSSFRKLEDK